MLFGLFVSAILEFQFKMGGTLQSKTYKVEKEHKKSGSELKSKSIEKKVDKEFSDLRESIKRDIDDAQKVNNQILEDTLQTKHVSDKIKLENNLSDDESAIKYEDKIPNGSEQKFESRETVSSQENQFEPAEASTKDEEKIVEGPEDIKLPHTLQNLLLEVNAEVCVENDICKPKSPVPESKPEENETTAEVKMAEVVSEKTDTEPDETKIIDEIIETIKILEENVGVEIENEEESELPQDQCNSETEKCELDSKEENISEPPQQNFTSKNEKASENDSLDKIDVIAEPTPYSNETNLNKKNLHVTINENYNENPSISTSNESCKILNEVTSSEIKENRNIDLANTDEINKITTTTPVDCEINNENLNRKIGNEEELETKDPLLSKIFEIEREIKNFYETVEGKGESYVLTLRELLIRSMVKLDNLEVNNELARSERKRVIKYAQSCLNSIPSTK